MARFDLILRRRAGRALASGPAPSAAVADRTDPVLGFDGPGDVLDSTSRAFAASGPDCGVGDGNSGDRDRPLRAARGSRNLGKAVLSTLLSASLATQSTACSTDAMLVFDGSASMAEITLETGNTSRLTEAREAIRQAMPLVERYRRIGLLTYGPGPEGSCEGIRLRFPPRPNAAVPIIEAIDTLNPAGLTPLSVAVETAAEAMDYRARPAIVVLVTDGNETCGGTPCATSRRLEEVAADLTIHVIGFRAARDFFAWDNPEQQEFGGDTVAKCFADRTGGLFLSTETVGELVEALQATLGCLIVGGRPLSGEEG